MTIYHPAPAEDPNPDQRTIGTITMAPSEVASAVADRVGFTALGSGHRVRAAASDDQEVEQ